jgi:signal transduction histidine kinase
MQELIEKDEVMHKILLINKDIGSIMELDILLNKIVKSLLDTIKADHGMLFTREKNKLSPKIFINVNNSNLGKRYFDFCQGIILDCATSKKSSISINTNLSMEKNDIFISTLAVPLIYKENLLGVLYADTITKERTLKTGDLSSAEIFAGQAAISINNAILYDNIKKKNLELLKLVNLKNEFINGFSDHLMKPVTEAKEEIDKIKSPQTEKAAARIDMIGNIIKKTLSLLELESSVDELFKDTVNIGNFIEKEILPVYKPSIIEKKLKIEMKFSDEFSNFTGNIAILRVIFDELISNAVMYNRPDGSICIQGRIKDNYYSIDIIDTGMGISDSEKESIFKQFFRGEEGLRQNKQGAGLGLFMVKNALSYYGGDIKIDSSSGKGTKFTISFLVF